MEWIRASITRQLVAYIGGALCVLMVLVTGYQVSNARVETQQEIDHEVRQMVAKQAAGIAAFFEAKGQVIHSVFASPQVQQFFQEYDNRGGRIGDAQAYADVIDFFKFFSDNDEAIKSVFFGSENTFEYFDLNGRYEDDPNYYTNRRPWWGEAISQNRLYVTDPAVDANDGSISATVKQTVYDTDGRFLGIGGMDILISTIGESLLSQIKYQQQGQAFLVTEKGKLVFFPGFSDAFPPGSLLETVDSQFSEASGFAQLASELNSQPEGVTQVEWQGQAQWVQWQPVSSDYPHVRWKLGFMLPKQVVDAQVASEAWSTALALALLIGVISLVVWMMSLPLKAHLRHLVEAMEEIAQGDGDLTRRIEVKRQDELGQLSEAFNQFAQRVHQLVTQSKTLTNTVSHGSSTATQTWAQTLQSMASQKGEVEQASAATTEMAETSGEMARSADEMFTNATRVHQRMTEAGSTVEQGKLALGELSQQMGDATDVVSQLRQNAEQIGEVLDVIRTIAEQTNLLALNAAIEAARAGEQGRGFAVVADEVRNLASKTQDSTANIQSIIETLQQSSIAAEKAMSISCQQVEQSQIRNQEIVDSLGQASDDVRLIQSQVEQMNHAISQQAQVADEIAKTVSKVHELSDEAVAQGDHLERSLEELDEGGRQLANTLGGYRV
ncbi:methyl-accepting chemotaxis protein [Ferrimonas aestuarii]|uniref:Methyl-accepting chemotaxis protein n=1 Tax=Ferrimonas aestuarii TaxID=2569539 RepID=A0A4U1BEL5_9GAMM|nr:methyl-accepting chemotaxis protein [Ferrimonas aestuarii]TKB49612.1 methyl-accepting chemotaxis protein [Ferrimonas aestuarii]